MKEYVIKRIIASRMWPLLIEDWIKINRTINGKYGTTNKEYQELIPPKQR
jgi:hypothetical protein